MTRLNPEQSAAVRHGEGPMLILAGAGSGKTRVITHRIASLIDRGVSPSSIVAVSFTNKAAGEMAERMVPLVGSKRAGRIRMSTFHSFGLGLLKEEKKAAGLDGRFVIFDQADSLGTVKEILREGYRSGAARRMDAMALLSRISNWKSAMLASDGIAASEVEYDEIARAIYPEYESRLQAMRALDFDDLVCRPVRLLRDDEQVRDKWRRRIAHLLVDEFQDTSEVQLELVKLLVGSKRNVCVVGDDDQSIYSWRGANPKNILEFEKHFPGTKIVKLETNYRSRAPILQVANAVIANSDGRRHEKNLRSAREGGEAVRRVTCESPRAEAQFTAKEIGSLGKQGQDLGQVAVLYRSNQQSRLVEEELTASGIPYRLYGGQQFFDRKEVKDTAAYLRFVVNPYDEISLRRVINFPARGIGVRSVQLIEEHAKTRGIPFVKAISNPRSIGGLPDVAVRGLDGVNALVGDARKRLRATGTLNAAARMMVERLDLRTALDETALGGKTGEQRYRNVVRLLEWLERYETTSPRSSKSLQDFLQRVTLNGDPPEQETGGGAVTLCTLHAAKGLEFDVVFLIGCIEGQLPHTRTTDPKAHEQAGADLDEERRLFYVGITRARDRLYLSAARRRTLRGKTVDVTPSRYMDELPAEHVTAYEREDHGVMSHDELAAAARELLAQHRAGPAPPDPA